MRRTITVRSLTGTSVVRCSSFRRRSYSSRPSKTDGNSSEKLFNKILIANRGEIACRVIHTARRLGIKTVAVYSEPDYASKHVQLADEAYCVGPAASTQSYLNIDNIMSVIKSTKSEAVHPGYGFLSENATFSQRCASEGVAFIGPSHKSIEKMGDKIQSKLIAKHAKVNVIPGYIGEVTDESDLERLGDEIGYPVMIKASAGGGGKGMRVAFNKKELVDSYRRARSEAKNVFNDDRVLIEKFIEEPRHIEIQIIGDKFGNTLWLPERECSIQRRNQKVVEEAPSPLLNEERRERMGQQAVALARAVEYYSAGTVEFLVSNKNPDSFYFLEMNTRLQVEHPITEYITGIDLVEQMIRVAADKRVNYTQEDVAHPHGWAIESRVYAEDPLRNFLPSIGKLNRYKEPEGRAIKWPPEALRSEGDETRTVRTVRCDSGVLEGSEIGFLYDPLISKLVSFGPNRDEAIGNMARALDEYVVRGLNHNINFLRSVMDNKRFLSGNIDTNFIKAEYPGGFKGYALDETERFDLAAIAVAVDMTRLLKDCSVGGKLDAFSNREGESVFVNLKSVDGAVDPNTSETPIEIKAFYESEEGTFCVAVNKPDQGYVWTYLDVEFGEFEDIIKFSISDDQEPGRRPREMSVQVLDRLDLGYRLQYMGTKYDVIVKNQYQNELWQYMPVPKVLDLSGMLTSPMPGKIVNVNVQKGTKVVAGQELVVVEAMKMQNVLRSEVDGIVKEVKVKTGDTVSVGEILVEFEKKESPAANNEKETKQQKARA